jgi:CubicO group peptidase (beta-lactamase class C family)
MTLAALLVAATLAPAAVDHAAIDAIVEAERQKQKIPGVSLAVVRDGVVIHSAGYGLANLEHDVKVTPKTIFQSGSVGKQFAAALVLLLADEGRLSVDDPIEKFVPTAPAHWKGITVRHLLTHTSGIPEYTDKIDLRKDYTEAQLVAYATEQPLDFAPGTSWKYSNTAYATLGAVVRKVTGRFYGDELADRIFRPIGMTTARVISEADIIPHRAAGYELVEGQIKNQSWVSPSLNTTADGALYLSLEDMTKWALALEKDQPLKKSVRGTMWTAARLADGSLADARKSHYGMGWAIGTHEGRRVIDHGGAWQGFQSYIARFPDDHLTVVAFANLGGSDPTVIARAVADRILKGR